MRKFWKIYIFVMVVLVVFFYSFAFAQETPLEPKSFAGVVWDKEGSIIMINEGIEYVNPDAFTCLSSRDFYKHARKIDLNIDCLDWKIEKTKKGLNLLNKEDIDRKEALTKMSPRERFEAALLSAGLKGDFILITERVVYPDTKNKGVTCWFTFIHKDAFRCKQ